MKKFNQLFTIFVLLMAVSCKITGETLENINIDETLIISNENISEANIGDKIVLKINIKSLKDGFHYMNTTDGNKFIVDVSHGEPKALYITNKAGKVLRGIFNFGNNQLEFSCGDWGCACGGHDDCIDMFGTDVCGGFAVCFGDPPFCICSR